MQGKGLVLFSVIMMVTVSTCTVSMSTSMARYNADMVGSDTTMEELALIMAAATEQELTANTGM